jgi:hypothetical protein
MQQLADLTLIRKANIIFTVLLMMDRISILLDAAAVNHSIHSLFILFGLKKN